MAAGTPGQETGQRAGSFSLSAPSRNFLLREPRSTRR
jgi:hypothetical protein